MIANHHHHYFGNILLYNKIIANNDECTTVDSFIDNLLYCNSTVVHIYGVPVFVQCAKKNLHSVWYEVGMTESVGIYKAIAIC